MNTDEAQTATSSPAEDLLMSEESEPKTDLSAGGDAVTRPTLESEATEESLSAEPDPAAEPSAEEGVPADPSLASEDVDVPLSGEAAGEALSAVRTGKQGILFAVTRFFSKRAVRIAAASLLAPILVSAGILIGVQLQEAGKDPSVDPDAEKYPYVGSVIPQEGEIAIPGYADMTFSANTQDVRVALINPEENDCYFVFSFLLGESAEEIYRSGLIPPGMAVTEQTLSRSLQAGEYLLVIRVQTYSTKDKQAMNSLDMEVRLTVN